MTREEYLETNEEREKFIKILEEKIDEGEKDPLSFDESELEKIVTRIELIDQFIDLLEEEAKIERVKL